MVAPDRRTWAVALLGIVLGALSPSAFAQGQPASAAAPSGSGPKAAVPGINLVVLLDISGSMKENGNLNYAPGLAEGLLAPVKKAAKTNLVFMTFDNMPRDEAADKQWVRQDPDVGEFAQRMKAAAVAGTGVGTEREWALARSLRLLERFVAAYKEKGYEDYINLVVVLTDEDADPKAYRNDPACAEDALSYDDAVGSKRLQPIRTDAKRGGDLLIEWYRYTLAGQVDVPLPGVAAGAPEEIVKDVTAVLEELVGLTPQQIQERAAEREEDLSSGALAASAGAFTQVGEDPYTFEGDLTVSTTYREHWALVGLDVTGAATADGQALSQPSIQVDSAGQDLAQLLIPPIRVDDAGAEVTPSVPIHVRFSFADRPTWRQFGSHAWTGTVTLAVKPGGSLFESDPSQQTEEWRRMNQVAPYDKGLVGDASVAFQTRVKGPMWPLLVAIVLGLAAIGAVVLVLRSGQRRVPLGLQVPSTNASYFIQLARDSVASIGGEFSSLPLGQPFDGVAGGGASVRLVERVPCVTPAQGVILLDAAGAQNATLQLGGEGLFSLRMAGAEGAPVDVQVNYAPSSFGVSDPLGGATGDYDLTPSTYDDDLLS